ncbi:MAG: hypothetical protein AB7N69_13075 [Immundisolibacter sp.]|uniref:hypothetical protein n=1 Tax=Immundisolibacter sp. TaxID=1934948 RepID=UPI003D12ECB6
MNARRIHELMRKHFPPIEHATRAWSIVQTERGANQGAIAALLAEHVASPEVVVEVHRKLGAFLPVADAPAYIGAHIGEGEIRIANREFTGFVVVALNGVATGWRHAG